MAKKQKKGGRFTPPKSWICNVCVKNPARTKEDIMPRWLRTAVRQNGTYPTNFQFPSELMRMCAECNGEFGKLESQMAPLLTPMVVSAAPVDLSTVEQELISVWTYKTVLLFQLARNPMYSTPLGAQAIRRELLRIKADRTYGATLSVRLGEYHRDVEDDTFELSIHNVGALPEFSSSGIYFFGHVFIEFVAGPAAWFDPFIAALPQNDFLTPIHPVNLAPVHWPPPQPLKENNWRVLGQAWESRTWPPPPDTPTTGYTHGM